MWTFYYLYCLIRNTAARKIDKHPLASLKEYLTAYGSILNTLLSLLVKGSFSLIIAGYSEVIKRGQGTKSQSCELSQGEVQHAMQRMLAVCIYRSVQRNIPFLKHCLSHMNRAKAQFGKGNTWHGTALITED